MLNFLYLIAEGEICFKRLDLPLQKKRRKIKLAQKVILGTYTYRALSRLGVGDSTDFDASSTEDDFNLP